MNERKIKFKDVPESYTKLAEPVHNSGNRVSVGLDEKVKEYFLLDIENLKPYSKQARKIFSEEELISLSETIKLHGILQPLNVIKTEDQGVYEVISGERRLRAAKMAGLKKVPCIIAESFDNPEEIALIENIQRSDLHPIELSAAYQSLLSDYNRGDQINTARKIGVSKSHMSEILLYGSLPEKVKLYLLERNIRSRVTMRTLLKCKDEQEMLSFLGAIPRDISKKTKKNLVSLYLKGGEIFLDVNLKNISEDRKMELRLQIEKILEELNS